MTNLRQLLTICFPALLVFLLLLSPKSSQACDRSSYKLDSVTTPSPGVYNIYTRLCIGGGILGGTSGANGNTNTFGFGFFAQGNGPFNINAFTPTSVNGDSTGCNMPGIVSGPFGPMGTQQTLIYQDPGCTNGFTCITTTANCGRPHTQVISFVFTTDFLPDSIRAIGIEGAGNPFSGCYNLPDMVIFPVLATACANDTIPPTIICPPNTSFPVDSNCQGILPNFTSSATVSDNCDPNPSVSQSPSQGTSTGGPGSTISVTLFASDNGQNSSSSINTSSCQFTATAADMTGPTLACPPNQTVMANSNCMAALPNYQSMSGISDNCDTNPSITGQSPTAGSIISGSSAVTIYGSDNASNTDSCSFMVTVQDQTAPTINCPPDRVMQLNNNCQAFAPNITASATTSDNCASSVTVTQAPASGTPIPANGQLIVLLTADDGANNTDTCSVRFTTADTIAPQITCPANVSFTPTTIDCNPSIAWTAPTGTDNCFATQSSTHNPGDNFPVGTTTVTYTVTDSSNNTAMCSFTVTVNPPMPGQSITPSNTSPCTGDTVTLMATPGIPSYLWSTNATSSSIDVTTSGWYYVDLSNGANCTVRDSILINFLPLPLPVITQSGNSICAGNFVTYQWYANGNLIPGSASICHTPGMNATYTVVVTDTNGCENTSAPLIFVSVDPSKAGPGFDLFPNPAHRTVHLQLQQDLLQPGKILIFDLAGKLVSRQDFERLPATSVLDLGDLAEGSYIVEISAGELHGRRRLIRLK